MAIKTHRRSDGGRARKPEKTKDDPGADRLLCVALRDVAASGPLRVVWLVVVPINLLEEGLGVECVGRARDAGDDRKRNQGGQDGLHGYLSSGSSQSSE